MKPVRITAPSELPVTLEEMKRYIQVDFNDDDATQQALIAAATDHLDGYSGILGRCLIAQQWACEFPAWSDALRLPFPDVTAATVTYLDAEGDEQTLSSAAYEIIETDLGAEIRFRADVERPVLSGSVASPVRVQFTAGYGAAADVPWSLKVAIMQLAAHWYDGDAEDRPAWFDALVRPYRVVMS